MYYVVSLIRVFSLCLVCELSLDSSPTPCEWAVLFHTNKQFNDEVQNEISWIACLYSSSCGVNTLMFQFLVETNYWDWLSWMYIMVLFAYCNAFCSGNLFVTFIALSYRSEIVYVSEQYCLYLLPCSHWFVCLQIALCTQVISGC